MKKILLASTALIASAGFAAADVTVIGDGYMGIGYSDGGYINARDGSSSDYAFVRDLDFRFVGTGESDSGLTFGAYVDADDASGAQGFFGWRGETFISGEFGMLSMGDTGGGAEAIMGDLAGVGLTGLGDFNETLFLVNASGENGPLALYEYSTGGIELALGMNDDEGYSVAAGYDGGMWELGLGYESIQSGTEIIFYNNNNNVIGTDLDTDVTNLIGYGAVTFSGVTLKGVYGQFDPSKGDNIDQYGISAAWTGGATTVKGYYRELKQDDESLKFYGVGAEYDLGGGLALEAGLQQTDEEDFFDGDTQTQADFGLSFVF
ncbi:porin [Pseudoruegeria sp. SK021]|uniref:porin n=1 Tax=Pseudoruegeria sp. SK021 TaxID=1933035 RepID=UPI000A23315B|nr:porin [Pseudoruegeria sp. SK021]OSP55061.1 hypothetical protein BV911_09570 [Pseudoruegeria sp. SK021]